MGRKATHGHYWHHPDPALTDVIRICQGRRAENRALCEAAYLLGDKWTSWRSLRTTSSTEAAKLAAMEFERLKTVATAADRHTVRQVADVVLKELSRRAKSAPAGKEHTPRLRMRLIERVILPALGEHDIREINDSDFLERWRANLTVRDGRPPSRSTLANINGAVQQINATAHAKGWLKLDQIRRLKQNRAPKGERRPTFSTAELHRLSIHMTREWIEAGHTSRMREHRMMLKALIYLIGCSGIRPGLEAETLRPEQVRLDHRDGIYLHVRSQQGKKTGSRSLIVDENDPYFPSVGKILGGLINEYGADPIFRRRDGGRPNYAVTFRHLLDEIGMRRDPITGRERTLYSLRHYYATKMLQRGVAPSELARRMGTSIVMFDLHYFHGNEINYEPAGANAHKDRLKALIASKRLVTEEQIEQFVWSATSQLEGYSTDEIDTVKDLIRRGVQKKSQHDLAELGMKLFLLGPEETIKHLIEFEAE
ncbi:MAG: site-specific integrase [Rhodospirillales bacterium]|nr:site-specific integrase [Rhodospirillales bacterium]